MREIIYRGKAWFGDWRYWRYGSLLCGIWNEPVILEATDAAYMQGGIPENLVRVEPETVGQYIGQRDRNGTRIFEGDILKGSLLYHDGEFNCYASVAWFEKCTAFGLLILKATGAKMPGISAGSTAVMAEWDSTCWEVIGNTYDNPGLVEKFTR